MAESGPPSSKSKDDAGANKELGAKKKIRKERIVDYNSSDEDSKDSRDLKPRIFELDPAKDYYCGLCRAQMNSDLTWNTHINGKRHVKKMQASNFGTQRRVMPSNIANASNMHQVKFANGPQMIPTQNSNETAQVQHCFDIATDEPIIGLDFVKEIWLNEESAEPLYHCTLCNADCQRITIFDHVIGSRHRLNYLEIKDEALHNRLQNSTQRKSLISAELAYEAGKMEKKYGRGFVKVAVQVDEEDFKDGDYYNYDNHAVEDMDLDKRESSPSDDDERKRERARPAPKPEPEAKSKRKEKKKPELSLEMRIKGTSSSTIRSTFAALSEEERLQFLESVGLLPNIALNEKRRAAIQLKDSGKILVDYIKQSPQRDQYVVNSLNGDFQWASELLRKWTSLNILRQEDENK